MRAWCLSPPRPLGCTIRVSTVLGIDIVLSCLPMGAQKLGFLAQRHAHVYSHVHTHILCMHMRTQRRWAGSVHGGVHPGLSPAVGQSRSGCWPWGLAGPAPPRTELSQKLGPGAGRGDPDIRGTKECSWLPSGLFTFCLVFWETNGKKSPIPTFLEAALCKQTSSDNFQS